MRAGTPRSERLHPLRMTPAYKDYIWGGDRIPRLFQRDLPPGRYAEAWEFSDRAEGPSTVAGGPWHGRTLGELLREYGADLVGPGISTDHFPLLVKLIDARGKLSVQVHPSDATAALTGGEPKTEAWYVLAGSRPDAAVYAGFKPGTDAATLRQALADGDVGSLLERWPVAPGDAIYIPGGLVHAIDAGCLLLETQQNSNTTYRVHDWNRVGDDGRPRELHLDQALRVIDWAARAQVIRAGAAVPGARQKLLATPYFNLERMNVDRPCALEQGAQALFNTEGRLRLHDAGGGMTDMPPGTSVMIPAAMSAPQILPYAGNPATLLRITWPGATL